jgi:hypothetical protein
MTRPWQNATAQDWELLFKQDKLKAAIGTAHDVKSDIVECDCVNSDLLSIIILQSK